MASFGQSVDTIKHRRKSAAEPAVASFRCVVPAHKRSAIHMSAPDRYRLECAGGVLHAGTADGFTSLTKPELRALAATARALAASAEAEIDARPVSFPSSLPRALVMQWLPLCDVSAALRVASSWYGDSEQYFRLYVEEGREAARVHTILQRSGLLSDFQQRVQAHYEHQPREYDGNVDLRYIPVEEVAAAIPGATVEQVRTAAAFLVSVKRLEVSATDDGHRVADLTSLERRVIDYHNEHGAGDEGCHVNAVAAGLGLELASVRTTVDYLCSQGHLYSTMDEDHHKSTS